METKVFIPLENGRIYLIDYSAKGSRQNLGYYRLNLQGEVKAVLLNPFHSEKTFKTCSDAQTWLKNQTKYV